MVILAGDHIYKMDYELMLQQHVDQDADVTVGCLEVPRMEAVGFGVMHVDEKDTITAFVEKPADPPGIPGQPDMALASMGIYVFRTKFLADLLRRDAETPGSSRDFGKDLIPYIVEHGKAVAHRFGASCVRSSNEARRLLARRRHRRRLLGGQHRPHRHHPRARPLRHRLADLDLRRDQAAGEVRPRRGRPPRQAVSSLVSGDCIISGAAIRRSLLFTGVRVHSYAGARRGGDPARRRHRPEGAAAARSWSTAASASPRASWSARTPRSTPSASAAPRAASA